jgi:hypothetical protein
MKENFNAEFWDSSQYKNFEEAEKLGGVRTWDTTYGISATIDAICNVVKIARMLSDDSTQYIKIRWEIDGENIPECSLSESIRILSDIEEKE